MVDYDGLRQWSLTFLTPGPNFVKDNFSINEGKAGGGFGVIQAHCIYLFIYFFKIRRPLGRTRPALLRRGTGCSQDGASRVAA